MNPLVEHNLQTPACEEKPAAAKTSQKAWVSLAVVFAGSLLLIWLIQHAAGAAQAGFGGFSDEPSHYVAGLLVHDYLPHLFRESPMKYVQDYHARIPYFALGVWPPLFYCIEGAWMLLFGVQRSSALWLVAISGAGLATLLYSMLKQRFGPWIGTIGAAIFLLVPVVQWSSCLVMADLTCSLFALATVWCFARYYECRKWPYAIWMGIFGGLSLLTKNSTYFVLMVPPIVILGTGSWRLLRQPALWLGGALVLAIYAPWLYVARSVLLLGIHGLESPGIVTIHSHFAWVLWSQTSFLFLLALAGSAVAVFSMWRYGARSISGPTACMIALLPASSLGIFFAKVPVQPRLLILAYGAVIFLAAEALWFFLRRPTRVTAAMMAALAVTGGLNWMNFRHPPVNDMRAGVGFLLSRDGSSPGSVLVPSSWEGPWIAEFAQADSLRPQRILVRPTKMLGEEDWNGSAWRPYYNSPEELQAFFERMPVKYCILARLPRREYPHDQMLRAMIAEKPDRWHLLYQHPAGQSGSYLIYENTRWTPAAELLVYQEANRVVNQVLKASR